MLKPFAATCGGFLVAALAVGCGTASPGPGSAVSSPAAPVGIARSASGEVPPGFRAASATFVSANEAFVLGTAPCGKAPCTSIARTIDRGTNWRRLPAPAVPLGQPGITPAARPAVWGIRFGTPGHGFVFGNGLWVTTDSGEHWSAAAYPGGSVMSLEIIDGQVLAVTMRRESAGNATWALLRRPLAGGAWTRLVRQGRAIGSIATQGRVAAIIDDSSVLVTRNGGRNLTRHALPRTNHGLPIPTSVAVEAPNGLALLSTGQGFTGHTIKTVYVSRDLGATWRLAGHPSSVGDGGVIAAAAPGQLTIATASAASWLFYSANNGRTWRIKVTYGDGGQGWNDLGFTTPGDGMVIHGHPQFGDRLGQLLLTDDGGRTWHRIAF